MEISWDRSRKMMHVSQQRYIKDAKAKSSINHCKVATKLQQRVEDDGLDTSTYPCRSLIGSLLCISTGTSTDIVYFVGKLSKYCDRATMQYSRAGIKVNRYLKATIINGLRFDSTSQLCSYSDCL
ncbi:hypothetical protein CCR75_002339 [Bremia lactucae]|uniref:Uncharacterized protein n=1 Tax=Bremia lactucae TaxID=4779 RepID=A0A976FN04_BRELC|nr:hypothetical protein CCR75_002339 [Bremia lactucae]